MAVLAAWGIIEGRSQAAREAERAAPVQVPSRVKLDDGGDPAVILDEKARKRGGVEVITAVPIRHQKRVRAYGTVVDLDQSDDAPQQVRDGGGASALRPAHRDCRPLSSGLRSASGGWSWRWRWSCWVTVCSP